MVARGAGGAVSFELEGKVHEGEILGEAGETVTVRLLPGDPRPHLARGPEAATGKLVLHALLLPLWIAGVVVAGRRLVAKRAEAAARSRSQRK